MKELTLLALIATSCTSSTRDWDTKFVPSFERVIASTTYLGDLEQKELLLVGSIVHPHLTCIYDGKTGEVTNVRLGGTSYTRSENTEQYYDYCSRPHVSSLII